MSEVDSRVLSKKWDRNWLAGWRDITNATNERTFIACALPKVASNHKLPLFGTKFSNEHTAALLGCFNSITVDYVARQKVGGTNLAFFFLKQFPILPPTFYIPSRLAFVTPRVLELTYTSHALAPFPRPRP